MLLLDQQTVSDAFVLSEQVIITIIGTAVPLMTVLGVALKYMLDYRLKSKEYQMKYEELRTQHHLKDQGDRMEMVDTDIKAASQLSQILNDVIVPLSARVKALEEGALNKTKQIIELSDELLKLKKEIADKDLIIDKLQRAYDIQLEITQKQEARINELETMLKHLQEDHDSGD